MPARSFGIGRLGIGGVGLLAPAAGAVLLPAVYDPASKIASGVGVKAGSTVTVYVNGSIAGAAVASVAGAWSYTFGTAPGAGASITYAAVTARATIVPTPVLDGVTFLQLGPIRGIDAVPPPGQFDAPSYGLTALRIAALHAAGFNALRLYPDLSEVLAAGPNLPAVTRKYLDWLHKAVDAGFRAIVCWGGEWEVQRQACDGGSGTAAFLAALDALCLGITAEFASGTLAFEMFNEPPQDVAAFSPTFAQAIAAVAPHLTTVLQAPGGYSEAMPVFDPAALPPNTAFSFHFYDTGVFTHQGTKSFKYVDRIPFPTSTATETPQQIIARATARIDADPSLTDPERAALIAQYHDDILGTFYDPSVDGHLWFKWPMLDAWVQQTGIDPKRVICSEFGVNGDFNFTAGNLGADTASRAAWMRGVRTKVEQSGFSGWVAHQAMGDFNLFQQTSVSQHGDTLLPWVGGALFG